MRRLLAELCAEDLLLRYLIWYTRGNIVAGVDLVVRLGRLHIAELIQEDHTMGRYATGAMRHHCTEVQLIAHTQRRLDL